MIVPLGPIFALGAAVGLLTPSETVDRLMQGLALDKVPDLQLDESIAVSAAHPERELVERIVGWLRAAGAKNVFMIVGTEPAARAAQDQGARWMLEIERSVDTVQARLRQVDAGLWQAPSSGIFASALVATSPLPTDGLIESPASSPQTVGPNPAAGLYGPARVLGEVPGDPLALAACPSDPKTLFVLTRSALYRVRLDEPVRVQAELPLTDLPRHKTPSRFPLGVVHCRDDIVAFGTSDLATGYEVDAARLEVRRTLPGAPLAFVDGHWLLGQLHEGQPRWRGPGDLLLWRYLSPQPPLILVAEGAIHRGDQVLSTSGLGASAATTDAQTVWIRTGLGPWGTSDEIQLGVDDRPLGEPVTFSTSVRATLLGRFSGTDWAVLVALPAADHRTSLRAVRAVLP